jgi:hypothetical protein
LSEDEIHDPIAVVLREAGTRIECTVTWQDEESSKYDLKSSSMHQAKHEVRAWLAHEGYKPIDRWRSTGDSGQAILRHFRKPPLYERSPIPVR